MYFINQQGEKDCGFTSLKILLANLYKKEELLYIKNPYSKESLSLFEIIDVAKMYGVNLKGLKVNKIDFKMKIKSKILCLIKKDELYHMVYVYKSCRKRIKTLDPKNGYIDYKKEEFLNLWTGIYLEIESYDKHKKFKFKPFIKKRFYLMAGIFQILSTCSILLGFYFMDEKYRFFVPLIFFTVFIIFLILNNINSKRAIKNIDQVISSTNKEIKSNFNNYFINITKYKSLVLVSPLKFVTNIIVIIFSILILCLNEWLNVIFLSGLLITSFIDYFVFENIKKIYDKDITLLENKIKDNNLSNKEFNDIYLQLATKTNKFSSIVLIRKYLILFIIFCLVFTMMAITKSIGINFLVFYYAVYLLIYQNLNESLSFNKVIEQLRYYKLQFASLLYE